MWICTVAGTPGTWVDGSSSGQEIGYAQIASSNITTTNVGAANRVDATGLLITPTVGIRPIMVEFFGSVFNTTINDGVAIYIIENASGNGNNTPILQQSQMISAGIASALVPFSLRVRLTPSAGVHTYKIMFAATVGGTATIANISSQPAFLRAVNC
jgi:hypothetical protein